MGELFARQSIGNVVIDLATLLVLFGMICLNVILIQTIVVLGWVRRWLKQNLGQS